MARKPASPQPVIEARQWSTTEEIDRAIPKLQRRISELEALDLRAAHLEETGTDKVILDNIRETIREVFGQIHLSFTTMSTCSCRAPRYSLR